MPPFGNIVDEANNATQSQPMRSAHSSNNVLNPNLSGSFKGVENDEEDEEPLHCTFEPVGAITLTSNPPDSQQNMPRASDATAVAPHNVDTDSVFIQTPTQGGIAVAALPHVSTEQDGPPPSAMHGTSVRFW